MDFDKLSFVLAGKLRQDIVKALKEPKTPSQLTQELKTQDASISRTLRELEKHGILKCLFPERKKGRLYALTNSGELLLKKI